MPRNFFGPKNGDGPQKVPAILDVRAAAELLHLSAWSIYELARQGKLPHYRVGGKILFSESKLAAWLELQAVGDEHAHVDRINPN